MTNITKLTVWETSDGKLHRDDTCAEWHQARIDKAAKAYQILQEEGDLFAALTHLYEGQPPDEILRGTTDRTMFAIPYLQCMDRPNYRVVGFTPSKEIQVHGVQPGPLGVCYGSTVSVHCLEDSAKNGTKESEA